MRSPEELSYSVKTLADEYRIEPREVIVVLLRNGHFATINTPLDDETVTLIRPLLEMLSLLGTLFGESRLRQQRDTSDNGRRCPTCRQMLSSGFRFPRRRAKSPVFDIPPELLNVDTLREVLKQATSDELAKLAVNLARLQSSESK